MATTVSHPLSLRTSPRHCGSHRLRRRGDAALAAGLRAGGQYPHGPPQRPLCQRAHGAHAPGPRTGPARRRHPPRGWRAAQRRRAQRHNIYQVDTRLLTCTCADYQKHLQACKHLLAVEIHLGALGLLPPSAPEPAAAEEPAPVQDPAPTAPAPSTASWPISEAPASLNIKLKIGQHGAHVRATCSNRTGSGELGGMG